MDDFGAHLSADERAELFLTQPPYEAQPILSEEEWAAVKAVCGDKIVPSVRPIE